MPANAMTALRTFYVSPAGTDRAAGTSSAPWRTLQHASNTADGLTPPAWSPTPALAVTPIAASHIEQLRTAVRTLE